jgi:hypothetical protein
VNTYLVSVNDRHRAVKATTPQAAARKVLGPKAALHPSRLTTAGSISHAAVDGVAANAWIEWPADGRALLVLFEGTDTEPFWIDPSSWHGSPVKAVEKEGLR